MSPASASRPGRRRSEDSRQAILAAAGELVAERGHGSLSVERIAQRAGVGKQTIYRWWPSKADVLMEALATKADLRIQIPDEGSFDADLRRILRESFGLARVPEVTELLRALMAEAQADPAFAERFRDSFLRRRRRSLAVVLDRAAARGELPAGVRTDTIGDVIFGTLWYRVLALPGRLDDTLADELVTLVTTPGEQTP